jgi:hypothetical protein
VFAVVLLMLIVRPQGLLPARAVLAREVPRRADLRAATRRLARLMRPAPARTAVADAPERGRRPLAVLLTEGLWPLLVLMVLTCVVSLATFALGPDSLDRVVLGSVINLIVVVGLYMFVGVSGVFSFGRAVHGDRRLHQRDPRIPPRPRSSYAGLAGLLASAQLDRCRRRSRQVPWLPSALSFAPLASFRPHRRARDIRGAQHRQHRRAQWEQVTHGTAGVSAFRRRRRSGGAGLGHAGDGGGVGVQRSRIGSACEPRARTRPPLARSVSRCP